MNKRLAQGAAVAFVSAASILPLAGGAQAAVAHDAPSAVSAWTHDHDGFRGFACGRFGRLGRFGHGGGRWDGGRWDGGRWGGGWWGGRFCGPSLTRWDKFERLDYANVINKSAIVILR